MSASAGEGVPATLMRGGSCRALCLLARDLPGRGAEREVLLARLLGSPDPSGRQIDGLGGALPETSRVVVVSASLRDDCDVDAFFGAVCPREGRIDWSGGESDLVAAAAMFALHSALLPIEEGVTRVRLWHAGARLRVDALVPVRDGRIVASTGRGEAAGVAGGTEVRLELLDPTDGASGGALLAEGLAVRRLSVPGLGVVEATVLGGAWPALFVRAAALGLDGRETLSALARDRRLRTRCQALLSAAAGMLPRPAAGAQRALFGNDDADADPLLVWVAAPATYRSAAGAEVSAAEVDLLARGWRGGSALAATPLSAAIAVAVAAAVPGSLVHAVARTLPGLPTRIGLPDGPLAVGADLAQRSPGWTVESVSLSHGARRLMTGRVYPPVA
jgi:2-methylaconitate cis-trans-isomerase PrpF